MVCGPIQLDSDSSSCRHDSERSPRTESAFEASDLDLNGPTRFFDIDCGPTSTFSVFKLNQYCGSESFSE
jgi:hypothetical protein